MNSELIFLSIFWAVFFIIIIGVYYIGEYIGIDQYGTFWLIIFAIILYGTPLISWALLFWRIVDHYSHD
jgi:hypothetical protein